MGINRHRKTLDIYNLINPLLIELLLFFIICVDHKNPVVSSSGFLVLNLMYWLICSMVYLLNFMHNFVDINAAAVS